ncbi:MAG TPA: hypothetical protein VEU96_11290 [Bryobacteraceae bacterium]|nr:hypothetical protein [Bryobacteraceae bacterium]
MKSLLVRVMTVVTVMVMALGVFSITTMPASAQDQGKNQDLGKNWRVFNGEPDTAFFWDINKPQALPGGLLQFPVQQFLTASTGSFVIYLYNNYNVDMTGKTLKMSASWTPGPYETRHTPPAGAFVRFEFQDVTSGAFTSNDYWWSTGANSLDLNVGSNGALTVSLTDRSKWTNVCGQSATDTIAHPGPNCVGGTDPAVSPFDGFTNAVKNVKLVGLAFGSGVSYASGVALDGGTGTFQLLNFTIAP